MVLRRAIVNSSVYRILLFYKDRYMLDLIVNAIDSSFHNVKISSDPELDTVRDLFHKTNYDMSLIQYETVDEKVLSTIEEFKREKFTVPIIVFTDSTIIPPEHRIELLKRGVTFFLDNPFTIGELIAIVSNLIELNEVHRGLEHAENIIRALARSIEARDPYTKGHGERVAYLSTRIFDEIGLKGEQRQDLYIGCLLHDIGKIALPDSILKKESGLNEEEYLLVRQHPIQGSLICDGLHMLKPALPIIMKHHERLDGSGYPAGFIEKDIGILPQIAMVADIYDALTSDRSYRKAFNKKKAFEIMDQEVEDKRINGYIVNTLREILNNGYVDEILSEEV